jgi:glycosyl hydrolase family 44
MIDYAGRIKAVDPSALVVGPEEWGWSGYLFSGYDQQYGGAHGWGFLPDRANHGGADYLPWLLSALAQNDAANRRRLLDVFTVHYYPQGGEFSDDVSSAMQLRRNRSTRSLWDPAYVDETWINDRVQLVRRLRTWVNTYYPGTATGITEYNWGAENHINGATTQADIYGIFGREGLDMAARWTTPASSTPTYKAMKMYRNYDGSRSTFGETSIAATTQNPDAVSAFAAARLADGALTIMIVNKNLSATTAATVTVANFQDAGTAQVWQLTAANSIIRLADVRPSGTSFGVTLPAQSVTLLVVPASSAPPSPPTNLRITT